MELSREDFRDEQSYQKYLYRLQNKPRGAKPKKQNQTQRIDRNHEAWRRWAQINNELE